MRPHGTPAPQPDPSLAMGEVPLSTPLIRACLDHGGSIACLLRALASAWSSCC
ncbi:MAG: hypothetical protein ACK587_17605 [Cyanobacteriota bacterium]